MGLVSNGKGTWISKEPPFSWKDKEKALEISDRKGVFPGMLKQREFRLMMVRSGKGDGDGIEPEAEFQKTIQFTGEIIEVNF